MVKTKIEHILRLGTRQSALALTQSGMIARKLERLHKGSGLRVELVPISTTGDRVTDKPLKEFGGVGVFVKELETALQEKRIDFAVHSLKDLPTRQPKDLILGAIVGREDPRDVAVVKDGIKLADLPEGSIIGSGSLRRRAQLTLLYPHLRFQEIRGNVDTRIRKVEEGSYAGTILARAGLKRLKLLKVITETISLANMLPAPGQGALGIECRVSDRVTRHWLKPLHQPEVAACVDSERALLQALGGGCHLPLGALAVVKEHSDQGKVRHALVMRAFLGLPDGSASCMEEASGALSRPDVLGQKIAKALLELGGREILKTLEKNEKAAAKKK